MTQPIAQALSARLRDMILAGEFRGGQHLREVQLAQVWGHTQQCFQAGIEQGVGAAQVQGLQRRQGPFSTRHSLSNTVQEAPPAHAQLQPLQPGTRPEHQMHCRP